MLEPEVYYNNRFKISKPVNRVNKKIKFIFFRYLQFGLKMKKIILEELFDDFKNKIIKFLTTEYPAASTSNDMNPDKFNYRIYCFNKDESGIKQFQHWQAAADPGHDAA